jgi:hypothetical protein
MTESVRSVPVRDTVQVLAPSGYTGYYCFEWEKAGIPTSKSRRSPCRYARVMREWLKAAGGAT